MAQSGNGRSEILRAARVTFAKHGFDGASIRDIAQEAGLSLSALYYYFPSKQDALYELIRTSFEWFYGRAHQLLEDTGTDPVDRLSALIRFTIRYRSSFPQVSRVILRDTERLPEERFADIRVQQRETRNLYSDTVKAGLESGAFRATAPDTAARAILSIINSIPLWFSTDGRLSPEDLERDFLLMCLRLLAHDVSDTELERLLALPVGEYHEDEALASS